MNTVAWMAFLVVCAALGCLRVDGGDAQRGLIAWQERTEVASGNAHRGPWRMNDSEWDFVDDPTVAINAQGDVGVAWAFHPEQDIFFQMYGPDGEAKLEKPVNVSRSGNVFSWLPRMIVADRVGGEANADAGGARASGAVNVYILWQEIVFSGGSHGGEIFFAKSTDGGRTFSDPINLSNTTAGAGKGRLSRDSWHNGSLDLAVGPDGHLYAAWTEYEGNLWFSRSLDGGESFSDPLHIAGEPGTDPARGPALAVHPGGGVHLVWAVGEDPSADIHHASSEDGGETFSERRIVHAGSGHADAPKAVFDSRGTLHLAYAESSAGQSDRYEIRYTRLEPGEDTFTDPRVIADGGTRRRGVSFPSLAIDGDDRLYVLWELFPTRGFRPLGLGYTVSTDLGETFAEPAEVPGTLDRELGFNGSQQGLLMNKLAVNQAGSVAVVNSTYRSGRSSHIWLHRGGVRQP